ncbi:Gypsy retrotransposon integrase-like protein 1, partial [Mucuna pruriens]
MRLAKELDAQVLTAKSDSKLVTGQVNREYQVRDPQLVKYWDRAIKMATSFKKFILLHVPHEQNELDRLVDNRRARGMLRGDKENMDGFLIKEASKYTLVGEHLYKRGFSFPLLKCLGEEESEYMIQEVHEDVCGTHKGGRELASKMARAGYYWPTLKHNCIEYIKKCDKCQRFAEISKAPLEQLHSVTSPWPFHKWSVDILDPFSTTSAQKKYLIVVVDYFTKYVEAEPIATISAERLICGFVRFSVDCRLLHTTENLTIVHISRAPLVEWPGRGSQQSHPEGATKMFG